MTYNVDFSEVDKVRFFTIGTAMYSGLTFLLHPMAVIKTRQQVLEQPVLETLSSSGSHIHPAHQLRLRTVIADTLQSSSPSAKSSIRGLYRGLGVVLTLAIPARVVYVTTLEGSREVIASFLASLQSRQGDHSSAPLTNSRNIATISAGLAGGISAVSAQLLIVPMDVISQKQMIMGSSYGNHVGVVGDSQRSAIAVFRDVLANEGYRGLYKGFGISLFTSLPTGAVWWATYSTCQNEMKTLGLWSDSSPLHIGLTQISSGVSAAAFATLLSQPLDVIKTRLQVQASSAIRSNYGSTMQKLYNENGMRGFYRGTGPRMIHMSTWGTILSSAYEYLKFISKKDG